MDNGTLDVVFVRGEYVAAFSTNAFSKRTDDWERGLEMELVLSLLIFPLVPF